MAWPACLTIYVFYLCFPSDLIANEHRDAAEGASVGEPEIKPVGPSAITS
jgi:hypothetical protein